MAAEKHNPRLTPRIIAAFRPYRRRVALVGLLILLTAGLGVVNPVLIQVVFDSALFPEGGPNLNLLWLLGAVMAGITVVTGGLGIVQTYLTNQVGQRVMRDLRDTLYRHLQSLSLGFFTGTRTGEIQSRVANDVGGVQRVVTNTVSDVLSNVVILVSTLIAMLVLSWELTHRRGRHSPAVLFPEPNGRRQAAGRGGRNPAVHRRSNRHHPGNPLHFRHYAGQTVRTAKPGN